jgi:hypothetical protein
MERAGARLPVRQAGVERLAPERPAEDVERVRPAVLVDVVGAVGERVAVGVGVEPVGLLVGQVERRLVAEDLDPPGRRHAPVRLVPVRQPVVVDVLLVVGQEAVAVDVRPGRLRRHLDGPAARLRAVAVEQREARAAVAHPGGVLVGEPQAVAVVVGVRVARVERVRIRALARIRQRARVVVERRLVLVAVGDRVAVAVGAARVGPDRQLQRVRQRVAVGVGLQRQLRALQRAGRRGRSRISRSGSREDSRGQHDGRQLARREAGAEALGEDPQAEARGALLAVVAADQHGAELARELDGEARSRRSVGLQEDGRRALAQEHDGVAASAGQEVSADDRKLGADLQSQRGDALDRRQR